MFATTEEQLKLLRFPLGGFYKSDIRKLAKYFSLQISEKPDSQDICFVSESYSKTIAKLAPQSVQKGKIVDIHGKVLGEHSGIVNFTVGQRRGLCIAHSEPLYVVRINTENNEVVVGPINALMQKDIGQRVKLVRTTKRRHGSNCEAQIITCRKLSDNIFN